jgi:hypothetical protein
MISIKGHEYHALSSIVETNSQGLDAFNLPFLVIDDNT